jgi:hypothetical protein
MQVTISLLSTSIIVNMYWAYNMVSTSLCALQILTHLFLIITEEIIVIVILYLGKWRHQNIVALWPRSHSLWWNQDISQVCLSANSKSLAHLLHLMAEANVRQVKLRSFQAGREDSSRHLWQPKNPNWRTAGSGARREERTVLIIETFYEAQHSHLHYFWH